MPTKIQSPVVVIKTTVLNSIKLKNDELASLNYALIKNAKSKTSMNIKKRALELDIETLYIRLEELKTQ